MPPPRRHFELPNEDEDGVDDPLPQPPPELRPRWASDESEANVKSKIMTEFLIG